MTPEDDLRRAFDLLAAQPYRPHQRIVSPKCGIHAQHAECHAPAICECECHWPREEPCGCQIDKATGRRVVLICRPHLEEARSRRSPIRPAIDRALDDDHRLCTLDPCTDCR